VVFADTASDYANRGAQKYIFGDDDGAEAEVTTGLTKFPNDPELNHVAGLLKKKPKQDKKAQGQQKQQPQQQQNQDSKPDQQKPDPNKDGNDKNAPESGETPTATPGDQFAKNQAGPSPSPSDNGSGQQEASPVPSTSPSPSDEASPSPSPGSGDGSQPEASPSASASASPGKKLSGDVKGAGEEKPNQSPQNAEPAQIEPEKEGQMSEKQAQLLLQSMKDEEQRVQLDERKAARHVYKDW
jgi:hypothetical protein